MVYIKSIIETLLIIEIYKKHRIIFRIIYTNCDMKNIFKYFISSTEICKITFRCIKYFKIIISKLVSCKPAIINSINYSNLIWIGIFCCTIHHPIPSVQIWLPVQLFKGFSVNERKFNYYIFHDKPTGNYWYHKMLHGANINVAFSLQMSLMGKPESASLKVPLISLIF